MLLFVWINTFAYSQINTEALRKNEMLDGLYHQVGLNFGFSSGNSNYFNLKSEYRTDFKTDKLYSFLLANLEYRDANRKVITSKGFAHIRFTYYLSQLFIPELFAQIEYNKFILLNQRKLIGTGLRFEIFDFCNDSSSQSQSYFYVGSGVMYENEDYELDEFNTLYARNTNYLTYGLKLNPFIEFTTTSYLQIAFVKLRDMRILNQSVLRFVISRNIKFSFNVNIRYDNEPLPDIKNFDIEVLNGLSLVF